MTSPIPDETAARLYRLLMEAVFVTGQARMLNVIEHDGLRSRIGVELHAVIALDSDNVQGPEGFTIRIPSVVDGKFENKVVPYRVHAASSVGLLDTIQSVLVTTKAALAEREKKLTLRAQALRKIAPVLSLEEMAALELAEEIRILGPEPLAVRPRDY